MAKQLPAWKASKRATLTAWRETLEPEDRDAMDAAWKAAKANASARRALADDRRRQIVSLTMQGLSADEIAARTGEKPRTVRERCAQLGIEAGRPGTKRTPAAFVSISIRDAIEALAAERGATAAETLADVLTFAFEEGAFHARRLLRAPTRV